MAKKATNDAKRVQMQAIMAGVFEKGWSPTEVAAVIGTTPSNISSWKMGKNMGTNEVRARLAALPGRNTSFATDAMEKAIARENDKVAVYQGRVTKAESTYAEFLKEAKRKLKFDLTYHAEQLEAAHKRAEAVEAGDKSWAYYVAHDNTRKDGMSSYEWDVEYHTKALEEARAKTDADVEAEAKEQQAHSIEWHEKELTKAKKYRDFVVKATKNR